MENCNFEVLDNDSIEIGDRIINLHTVPMNRLEQMAERYERKAESDDDFLTDGYYTAAHATLQRVLEYRQDNPDQTPEDLFAIAKQSQVGEEVACPQCKNSFTKRHPQQTFCSNARSRKGGNCKDRYYNMHKEYRKERIMEMQESIDA